MGVFSNIIIFQYFFDTPATDANLCGANQSAIHHLLGQVYIHIFICEAAHLSSIHHRQAVRPPRGDTRSTWRRGQTVDYYDFRTLWDVVRKEEKRTLFNHSSKGKLRQFCHWLYGYQPHRALGGPMRSTEINSSKLYDGPWTTTHRPTGSFRI